MSTVDAPAPAKRCSKCAEVKPLTEFNRNARSRDGRQAYCRECQRARYREHADAGLCTWCGEPAEPGRTLCAEHLGAKRARRRERTKAGLCRECGKPAEPGRSLCMTHQAADRARTAARVAAGRCQQNGCPHMAEPGHTRCAEHLAAHRAHDRKRIADGRAAAAKRAWRERNVAQGYCENGPGHGPPVAGSTKCARCRAREQARYRKTLIEYTAILADQGVDHDGRCELCGLAEATQVDHVLPRTLGGIDDDPLLLRWVCATCNASRGNNTAWVPPLTAWDVEEDR